MDTLHGVGKVNVAPRDSFPPFPSHYVPSAALWRSIFLVKLDAMHRMRHIGREMNAGHPRRKKFLVDLSHAIFVQHEGDRKELVKAREAAGPHGG